MKEVHRVVEYQASIYSFRATQDEAKALQLELLIEQTKPPLKHHSSWHDLIATPFRYSLPVPTSYSARFRPPASHRNVFYASTYLETALFEYSYHFMRQRVHLLQGKRRRKYTETGTRTSFSVNTDDSGATDIRADPNVTALMDRHDLSASHAFIRSHATIPYLVYPSTRDPNQRDNVAIFEITKLSRTLNFEQPLNFFYDFKKREVFWINKELKILWSQVS
jgi:hypothetical protein